WTTTPWTIPSNLAIAVHPDREYKLVSFGGRPERLYVVAAERLGPLHRDGVFKATSHELGRAVRGAALVGLRYAHPLPAIMRGQAHPGGQAVSFRVVAGDYVTMDAGTGLVHTAPGAGEDDFQTGKREGLPILSPVDGAGRFTDRVVKYHGKKVLEANPEI